MKPRLTILVISSMLYAPMLLAQSTAFTYQGRLSAGGSPANNLHAAFGLGESDRTITTVDADGVALAAIQGLNEKLEDKEMEIRQLKSANAALEHRLSWLEQVIRSLAPSLTGRH